MDTDAWLDQQDAETTAMIRRHRWIVTYVGEGCTCPGCAILGDGPAFAYTVGMFGLGHPELLVFSVGTHDAGYLLNALGNRIVEGEALMSGIGVTVDGFGTIVPEAVPNPGQIVFEANRFYDRPDDSSVPVLQLTYPDAAGRFPWDAGYAGPPQPRPGTFRA